IRLPVRDLDGESFDRFYLKQKVTKLQEVIVSNFITKGIDVNSDGSFKIDAGTLGILPGLTDPDVLQTIQALPGIQSINETVSDINVRGGTNDQNLIFWDGIKMYQSGHFFGLISAFNPYITKEVVLIKNGTTTALSDGVSSTIDIRTDDKVSQNFSGGAGINMINADLFFKIPLAKNVSLQLSSRRSISDLVHTPTYDQYFNRIFRNTDVTSSSDPVADTLVGSNEKFNFYDITAKLLYNISGKDKLRISFLRVFNTINYEENALVNNVLESKTSGLEQQTTASSIVYRRLWSDKLVTTAQLYFSGYELGAINFDVLNDQRLIQENKILDTGLKLDARIALSNTLDLFTGYQLFEVGITNLVDINNPTYRRLIKRVLRSHAAFAEGNYSSGSGNTNLRLGLRANYFEKFNLFILEPRLAFNQRFLGHFSFEVLGEMKSQTTTQVIDLQNDFLGVEKRRWVLANEDDIPVVESKQVSAGLRYQQGNFLVSLDGYIKQVNGITSSSQGFQNQFQYVRSSGSYEVSGLDFLINQRIGKFTTWLSYSYAENTYEFSEFIPPVFPNNLDIRHTTTFGSSFQTKNFQLSAGLNWRTGKPYTLGTDIIDGKIVYENPNNSRLDDYLRIDLSAKYLFQFSKGVRGEIGASLWNILDNQNIVNIYFQVDENGNLETIQQSALGFTPNFMFRVSF
ncbi:MAG: TonB-dependent receptor plug domain-containing protein, partial [Cyclobacteriaceae bacterium]|nr:TonB-dependent receptor plug domain-containing protein [Cyclobacteriaceae bacterium]